MIVRTGGAFLHALHASRITRPLTMKVAPVNAAALVVVVWDCLKRVVRWSPGAEAVFGWKAEEVLGKRFDEWPFIAGEDLPLAKEAMIRVAVENARRDFVRLHHIRKDGTPLWCEWRNHSVTGECGELVCILSYGAPIHESTTERDVRCIHIRAKRTDSTSCEF